MKRMIKAVIESPYAGEGDDLLRNIVYARCAVAEALKKGFAPIASHLLYTQPAILNDAVIEERRLGIEAGLVWAKEAEVSLVFADLGITEGMKQGVQRAYAEGRRVIVCVVPGWKWPTEQRLIDIVRRHHRSWF